jgi:hypothetical protein
MNDDSQSLQKPLKEIFMDVLRSQSDGCEINKDSNDNHCCVNKINKQFFTWPIIIKDKNLIILTQEFSTKF